MAALISEKRDRVRFAGRDGRPRSSQVWIPCASAGNKRALRVPSARLVGCDASGAIKLPTAMKFIKSGTAPHPTRTPFQRRFHPEPIVTARSRALFPGRQRWTVALSRQERGKTVPEPGTCY